MLPGEPRRIEIRYPAKLGRVAVVNVRGWNVKAAKVRAKKEWEAVIVTEISPLKEFYVAEDYHQNYFNLNKNKNPYCSIVIAPKLHKLIEKGILKE